MNVSCCQRTQNWVQQHYFLTGLYCTITAVALYFLATTHIPNNSKLIVGVVLAGGHIGLVIYFLIPPPPPKGPNIKEILLKQGYEESKLDGRVCYQKVINSGLTFSVKEIDALVKTIEAKMEKDLPDGTFYGVESQNVQIGEDQFRIVVTQTVSIIDEAWLIAEGFQKGYFGKFTKVYPDGEDIDEFPEKMIVAREGQKITVRLLD